MPDFFAPLIMVYKVLYLFAYDITGNYGNALVLLSLFIFIVLFPFNSKMRQIQNEEREVQSVLLPQLEIIKKQYHGKEQYEKTKRLYHRYSYHPIYALRSAAGIILQIPFFIAARSMLYNLQEIKGVSWGIIENLGAPDHLLDSINLLPFLMTFVTVLYAFVMPRISKKEIIQTIFIGVVFLIILYPAPSALLIFWTCNLLWSLLHCLLFDRLQWFNDSSERVGEFFSQNDLAFHVMFSLSITTGLLVPTEVYIKNASELWFEYKDILKYFIADTAKYFVILLIIYFICRCKKVKAIYLAVLLGLLFGVFLQSYIISVDYGMFDGHEIEWNNYTKIGLINTFIWLFCLGATFIKFKRLNFDLVKIKKIVKPICFCVFVIQCLVLVVTIKANPTQKIVAFEDGKAGVLTTKDIYTISSKDNIIIFLLDAFDASIFEEIQQKNPKVIAEFKDFTYYPDTTSSFGFTHYSLPEILTGKLYDPKERYLEYQKNAWSNNSYYNKLKENGYTVNLYTSGNFVDKNAPVNNLITKKIQINRNVVDIFTNVAKFRMVPHYVKRVYYAYQPSIYSPALANENIMNYIEDDRAFYIGLKRGLKSVDKNAFRFYHLAGMHFPYVLNENVEYIKEGEKGTAYKQALGSLKIVREYLSQMKEKKLYDNSTFIVMADHGYHNQIGSRPLFMIKQPFSANEAIHISSEPQSVAMLMSYVMERFGSGFGNKKIGNRYFYYEDKNQGMRFYKYLVKKPAKELTSWISLGPVGRRVSTDKTYKIGEEIDFSCFGNSYKYKNTGWQDREETFGSAIDNHEADMNLVLSGLENKNKDLTVEISCHPLLHFFPSEVKSVYRNLDLYANNNHIGQWHITEQGTQIVDCELPLNLIDKGKLHLRFIVTNPMNLKDEKEVFQINKLVIKEQEK